MADEAPGTGNIIIQTPGALGKSAEKYTLDSNDINPVAETNFALLNRLAIPAEPVDMLLQVLRWVFEIACALSLLAFFVPVYPQLLIVPAMLVTLGLWLNFVIHRRYRNLALFWYYRLFWFVVGMAIAHVEVIKLIDWIKERVNG